MVWVKIRCFSIVGDGPTYQQILFIFPYNQCTRYHKYYTVILVLHFNKMIKAKYLKMPMTTFNLFDQLAYLTHIDPFLVSSTLDLKNKHKSSYITLKNKKILCLNYSYM